MTWTSHRDEWIFYLLPLCWLQKTKDLIIEEGEKMVPFLSQHCTSTDPELVKKSMAVYNTPPTGIDQKQSEAKEYDSLAFALAKMRYWLRRGLQEYADSLYLMAHETPPPFQHLPVMTILYVHHHVAQVLHHHHSIHSKPLDPFIMTFVKVQCFK